MILVIDNYDSFTFNLVQMLGGLGAEVEVRRNDAVDDALLEALRPRAVVVSPGPSHPDRAGRSAAVVRWALGLDDERDAGRGAGRDAALGESALRVRCPVLGVCLGHQVVARVFGARVERAPAPVHGKPARVRHDGRGLFAHLPVPFEAGRYHSLAVVEETLPADLVVTSRSEDGVIMGIRHRELPVEGVQFHPESILTEVGEQLLGNFVGWVGTGAGTGTGTSGMGMGMGTGTGGGHADEL